MTLIQEIGIQFISWLQAQEPQIGSIMELLAILVRAEFVMIFVLPLLAWNLNYRRYAVLFSLLMIDIMIGDITKVLLAQPRPWWIADIKPLDYVTSVYSSPGGYTSMATVFWGYLYLQLKRPWIFFVGSIFIVLTSIAKMYHASTLPDHAILGLLQGGIVLVCYMKFKNVFAKLFWGAGEVKGLMLAILFTGSFFVLMIFAFLLHSTYQIPMAYLEYKMIAADRFAGGGITMSGGLFFGCLLGQRLLVAHQLTTVNENNLTSRIFMSVIGLVVLALLMAVIRQGMVEGLSDRLAEGIINFFCTSASGFFIFYGIHRLFYKHQKAA